MFGKTSCALALAAAALVIGGKTVRADVYNFKANTKLETLATVSNDRNADLNILSGMVDDRNDLTGIEFTSVQNGHEASKEQFSMAQVAQPNGVVLINSQGIDALILRGKVTGGEADLVVKFIFNGITHEYHECKVQAIRATDNSWHLKNAYNGQTFSKAKIISGSIGIKTIQGICP